MGVQDGGGPPTTVERARPRSSASLTRRAIVALALMVGFYLLALAIIAALIGFLVFEFREERVYFGATAAAVIGVYAIIVGIVPRRVKFVPPGPRLAPDAQPRLMEEIREVADATGSPMPSDVYLTADVNAGVAHVGGFVGIGARPIMIVGLPLMAALTTSEFRGVIAHEFGHYAGGETRLAPLIYRTREAIFRTVGTLARRRRSYLHLPFVWYGRMYLRLTQSISRAQELDADAHAARIAGGRAMEEGLTKVHTAALAVSPFLDSELAPVLVAGYRPPVAEGFTRFLHGGDVARVLDEARDAAMKKGASDPYDSHPSLRERLDALRDAPHGPAIVPDPPAIELIRDEPAVEADLLDAVTELDVRSMPTIAWNDVTARVWLTSWEALCRTEREALVGITPGGLPAVARDSQPHIERIQVLRPGKRAKTDALRALVGAGLTVVLAHRGWVIEAGPGEAVTASHDGTVIETFEVLPRLMRRELAPDEWERTCRTAGIADLDLSGAGDAGSEPSAPANADGVTRLR